MIEQVVDEAVSRAKFTREVEQFRGLEAAYAQRGIFMVGCAFPEVLFLFTAPAISPTPVVFGALLRFDNYDIWAPSVTLCNPHTRVPYKISEVPTQLIQLQQTGPNISMQPLVQSHKSDDVPFICLAGVREYHDHPAHTGDSWFLHRSKGEGTLAFIVESLWRFGSRQVTGFRIVQQVVLNTQVMP